MAQQTIAYPLSIARYPPRAWVLPVITGEAVEEGVMTLSTGTWINGPVLEYGYRWKADGVELSGETSNTLTLSYTYVGATITGEVRARNGKGWSAWTASEATSPLANGYDYYVDSVNGDDGNAGTSGADAFETIAALPALTAGVRIGLARGSSWREQLGTENGAISDVSIGAFGTGRLPILDASDLAGAWAKTATYTNVYDQTWTHAVAVGQYISVWEDGERLRWVASIALCDATAGTFYAADTGAGGTSPVYIHATGSGNPGSNGKVYEISKRHFGVVAGRSGSNWSIKNVHPRRSLKTDGPLGLFGQNCYASNCLIEDGTRHNVVLGSGLMEDCIAWKCDWADRTGITLCVGSDDPATGKTAIFRRCIAIADPAKTGDSVNGTTGIYAHGAGFTDYTLVAFEDCSVSGVTTGLATGVDANLAEFIRCYAEDVEIGFGPNTPLSTLTDCYVKAGSNLSLQNSVKVDEAGTVATIEGLREDGQLAANLFTSVILNAAGKVTLRRSALYAPAVANRNYILGNAAGAEVISELNIIHGSGNHTAYRTVDSGSSDNNVYYPATIGFRYGGNTYADFAAWRAAHPEMDANTSTDDPLFNSPTTGDFGVAAGSPAIALGAGLERPDVVYTPLPSEAELEAM